MRGRSAVFATARHGVAAVEFALLAGLLSVVLLGLYDLTNAYILWRRLTQAAQSISEIATKLAVQTDGSNSLTSANAQLSASAVFAIVPGNVNAGATMNVVVFTPTPANCTVNCTYSSGKLEWSITAQGSVPAWPCGTYKNPPTGQPADQPVLPADAFQAASILVVEVAATYDPLFLKFFSGPFTLTKTAYLPPRSGTIAQWIRLTGAPAGATCP